jgi:N6-L-threonylcarbamoyladenine synthase
MAKEGEANILLPITHFDNFDFSFSGIKTAVINLNHKDPNINKQDLCASFESAVTTMIMNNVKKAIKEFGSDKIVLAGGVSRNSYIRDSFDELSKDMKVKVYYPEGILCTDNAAMIASSGYYEFVKGKYADLSLNAIPNLKL